VTTTTNHGRHEIQPALTPDIWRPDRPLRFLGLTGARGCGKTKLLEWLLVIFGQTLFGFDSSKACDDLKEDPDSKLGKELLRFEARRAKGEMYPCELVIRVYMHVIKKRLDAMKRGESVACIGMAGAPRTKLQDELLQELSFILSLIHIETDSLRQVFIGMLRRNRGGEKRMDDNIESAVTNFDHYEKHIRPYARQMPRDRAVTVKFGDPLIEKVDASAEFIARVMGGEFVLAYREYMGVNNPLRVKIVEFEKANSGEIVLTPRMQEAVHEYERNRRKQEPEAKPASQPARRLSQFASETYGSLMASQR